MLTEYLRTWPETRRSSHPNASLVAVGAKAKWITENQPLQHGYRQGSPLAKLVEVNGNVLLLGAPFSTITLLHYVEHMANLPNKKTVSFKMPVLCEGKRV